MHLPLIMGKNEDKRRFQAFKRRLVAPPARRRPERMADGYRRPSPTISPCWAGVLRIIRKCSPWKAWRSFSIDGISKSPAVFDYDKLTWFNGEYIRNPQEGTAGEALFRQAFGCRPALIPSWWKFFSPGLPG